MKLFQLSRSKKRRVRRSGCLQLEHLEGRRVLAATIVPLIQTFELDSLPTATKTIFLDFTGHRTTGSRWNYDIDASGNWSEEDQEIICTPFTLDSDFNFNEDELRFIQDVWARVAEDYAPFQVNVTTREPALDLVVANPWFPLIATPSAQTPLSGENSSALLNQGGGDNRWGVRVVISDGSRPGDENPADGGGVAWGSSFGGLRPTPTSPRTEAPCFVDVEGVGAVAANVAEAAAHEAGHTLGLDHDGMSSGGNFGNNPIDYYRGHGTGATSWAPIMGAGYGRNVTQWSKGEYASANNAQDDLAVLSNFTGVGGFSYRPDDNVGTTAGAKALTRPVGSTTLRGSGIIERNTDADMFSFTVTTGRVDLQVRPLDVIDATTFAGANLDVGATLLSADGRVVADLRPGNRLDARFIGQLTGGRYFVKVFGTGNGDPRVDGYSNYGSLGRYTVDVIQTPALPTDPPLVTITGPAAVAEGSSSTRTASFVVALSKAATDTVTVNYATRDGSATLRDADYQAASGTLTFAPGETRKTIAVAILGDTNYEPDETFSVELSGAVNATLGRGEASATIRNDDRVTPPAPLMVSVVGPGVSVVEGPGSTADFTITLSALSTTPVTVFYRTVAGTATANSDFVSIPSGSVTFAPGEIVKTVSVSIIDDARAESDEWFTFQLVARPGYRLGTASARATIEFNDGGSPSRTSAAANALAFAAFGSLPTVSASSIKRIR